MLRALEAPGFQLKRNGPPRWWPLYLGGIAFAFIGQDLFPKAINMKVAYVYGSPFYANGGGENTMRLNFSCASMDEIDEGIKRLTSD